MNISPNNIDYEVAKIKFLKRKADQLLSFKFQNMNIVNTWNNEMILS